MRIRALLLTGCVAALARLGSSQCLCDCPCEGQGDPCDDPDPPEYCSEPDPCLGDDPPEWCGPSTGDPCDGPDRPWYCPGVIEDPFSVIDDSETGFRFTQYKAAYSLGDERVVYRVARPGSVSENQGYDVVIQVQAPVEVGWAGLAWGATMKNNPLTVVWANCSSVVISSRWAASHALPTPYDGATYSVLESATFVNKTHYQVTAKCSGCTSWTDPDLGRITVTPTGFNEFAWAYAIRPPMKPGDNTSAFAFHDAHAIFENDLADAGNEDFEGLVLRNSGPSRPGVVPSGGECLYTKPPVDDGRITVTRTETTTFTVTEAPSTVFVTVTETDEVGRQTTATTPGLTVTTTVVSTACLADQGL
ncbi:hypothetical protein RB595_005901 [Gaeumannomyces hyphopodioides]